MRYMNLGSYLSESTDSVLVGMTRGLSSFLIIQDLPAAARDSGWWYIS